MADGVRGSAAGQAGAERWEFRFDRRKTWPFVIMLVVMMAIGLTRLAEGGIGEEWPAVFLLVAMPALAMVMIGGEFRLRGPVLIIDEEGLTDRRRGERPVPWEAIAQATVKRRGFNKGVRVVLTDGARYDVDLGFLSVEPNEIMRLIQLHAGRATQSEARLAAQMQ